MTEKENSSTAQVPAVVDNTNVGVDTNTKDSVETNANVSNDNETEKEYELKTVNLNLPFLYDLMSVPTYSRCEYRMQMYIVNWARARRIDVDIDKKGNLYLTKGKLEENEYYPCVTSHMDTVQEKSKVYVEAGARLDIKDRVKNVFTDKEKEFYKGDVKHEIYVEGMGIGADDKAGVFISLSLMERFDKMKAVFFVEEEIGMQGSKDMCVEFFDDCGYCIGWDSPDLNRAAWRSSGTRLFSVEFYDKFIKDTCDEWGLTDFRSEPFTDIINIREKTGLMCMNFGNGGYDAHGYSEYCVIEDMDHALGMGIALVEKLGNKLYRSLSSGSGSIVNYLTGKKEIDVNNNITEDDSGDDAKLGSKFNTYVYGYNNYWNANNNNNSSTYNHNTQSSTNTNKESVPDVATMKYIADTYESYVENIKGELQDKLKEFCETNGLDYETSLSQTINKIFGREIKF